jgi:hypothetical protein
VSTNALVNTPVEGYNMARVLFQPETIKYLTQLYQSNNSGALPPYLLTPSPLNITLDTTWINGVGADHPIRIAMSQGDNQIDAITINVQQLPLSQAPTKSGEVQVAVTVIGHSANPIYQKMLQSMGNLVGTFSYFPRKLNQFSLLLETGLYLDGSSTPAAPATDQMPNVILPVSGTGPGLNFYGPVYINGPLQIPDPALAAASAPVTFHDRVVFGQVNSITSGPSSAAYSPTPLPPNQPRYLSSTTSGYPGLRGGMEYDGNTDLGLTGPNNIFSPETTTFDIYGPELATWCSDLYSYDLYSWLTKDSRLLIKNTQAEQLPSGATPRIEYYRLGLSNHNQFRDVSYAQNDAFRTAPDSPCSVKTAAGNPSVLTSYQGAWNDPSWAASGSGPLPTFPRPTCTTNPWTTSNNPAANPAVSNWLPDYSYSNPVMIVQVYMVTNQIIESPFPTTPVPTPAVLGNITSYPPGVPSLQAFMPRSATVTFPMSRADERMNVAYHCAAIAAQRRSHPLCSSSGPACIATNVDCAILNSAQASGVTTGNAGSFLTKYTPDLTADSTSPLTSPELILTTSPVAGDQINFNVTIANEQYLRGDFVISFSVFDLGTGDDGSNSRTTAIQAATPGPNLPNTNYLYFSVSGAYGSARVTPPAIPNVSTSHPLLGPQTNPGAPNESISNPTWSTDPVNRNGWSSLSSGFAPINAHAFGQAGSGFALTATGSQTIINDPFMNLQTAWPAGRLVALPTVPGPVYTPESPCTVPNHQHLYSPANTYPTPINYPIDFYDFANLSPPATGAPNAWNLYDPEEMNYRCFDEAGSPQPSNPNFNASLKWDLSPSTFESWNFMPPAHPGQSPNFTLTMGTPGPPNTYNVDASKPVVMSIATTCYIDKSATKIVGFLTCQNLKFSGGRSKPLNMIGTFIVGGIDVGGDGTVYKNGVNWYPLSHPTAVSLLQTSTPPYLKSVTAPGSCTTAMPLLPSKTSPNWDPEPGFSAVSNALHCSADAIMKQAPNFAWSQVSPNCGYNSYDVANISTGGLMFRCNAPGGTIKWVKELSRVFQHQ